MRHDEHRMRAAAPGPLAFAVVVIAALAAAAFARPILRSAADVGRLLAEGPHAGDCESCHTAHGEDALQAEPHALVGPNDNTLCESCHAIAWIGGSYPGTWLYAGSAHGSSTSAIWPGPEPPARGEVDAAGKCLNCHDPHGWEDGSGRIPGLRLAREESLCIECHDGHPGSVDVRADFFKPYVHPVDLTGRHTGPGETQPSDFAITPVNRRHAECEDCHNPHMARGDATPPVAPAASKRTLGVSRVAVLNGAAGSPPSYRFIPASDTLTAPVAEYQLCFKCHSSWTVQPPGQPDLARELNPNNPSYHPVEGMGRNLTIHPLAFRTGWSATSMVRCGSCHGSDSPEAAGVHGSVYRSLLRAPYDPAPDPRRMTEDELCFTCHEQDVYANPGAPSSTRMRSRFNTAGMTGGHTAHVFRHEVPCGGCHVTHGSATHPFLIGTGDVPGLIAFDVTPTGATCSPTCHAPQSYTVNYAR